jgi:hypothetical protein
VNTPLFNSETHTYATTDGRPLISVTQALSKAGLIDTTWFNEAAAWRGSCIHECCRLWDLGKLKESSVDPQALPYLDAWREFCVNTGFKPKTVEVPRYHPTILYAGTEDVECDGMDVDRKTGAILPWHAIQLALYANFHPSARSRRRFTVRLQSNGKYSVKEHSNFSADLAVGLSAINVANWKRTNNA